MAGANRLDRRDRRHRRRNGAPRRRRRSDLPGQCTDVAVDGIESGQPAALDLVAAQLAPARHRGSRRRGIGRAAFFRSLDRQTARARQRSVGGRSRWAAADAGYSGAAVFAPAAVAAERDHRIVSGTGSLALSVAIIDYGSGNLHSAAKAFERASRGMQDPQKIVVTRDPEVVFRADRIVLPGVGAFADCRRGLDALDGMIEAMTEAVRSKARPFFGICVGMQLMATRGKEHVTTDGFNWISGDVEKITPREENLKIPHMGWNTLDMVREHPVLERLPLGPKGRHAYFVHSYHLNAANEADVLARADYGGPVTAIVGKDTAIGTQFHPEKSQRFGLALISNFLKWKP